MMFQDIVQEEMDHDDHQDLLTQNYGDMIDTLIDEGATDIFNGNLLLEKE